MRVRGKSQVITSAMRPGRGDITTILVDRKTASGIECVTKTTVFSVFNRIYPVIDHAGGGSIRGWITRLEEVAETYPTDAIYLCGHGNPKFGVTFAHGELHVLREKYAFCGKVKRSIPLCGAAVASALTL